MINARLDGVARTLALTLRARAREQDHESPLFHDPWSAQWYTHLPKYEDYDGWYNPAFELATIIRSLIIDELVAEFIKATENPLIIELGSGFSTRYYRIGENHATWIELDLEEAIIVRRKIDVETDDHWFLASDITSPDWVSQLPERPAKDTLFIAEGVLMFSEPDTVSTLFKTLGEHASGAKFIFDVVNPGYIAHVQDDFQQLNAPILWGITEDELKNYNLDTQSIHYLLLEFGDRWDEIGIDSSKRQQEHSGFVVESILT